MNTRMHTTPPPTIYMCVCLCVCCAYINQYIYAYTTKLAIYSKTNFYSGHNMAILNLIARRSIAQCISKAFRNGNDCWNLAHLSPFIDIVQAYFWCDKSPLYKQLQNFCILLCGEGPLLFYFKKFLYTGIYILKYSYIFKSFTILLWVVLMNGFISSLLTIFMQFHKSFTI